MSCNINEIKLSAIVVRARLYVRVLSAKLMKQESARLTYLHISTYQHQSIGWTLSSSRIKHRREKRRTKWKSTLWIFIFQFLQSAYFLTANTYGNSQWWKNLGRSMNGKILKWKNTLCRDHSHNSSSFFSSSFGPFLLAFFIFYFYLVFLLFIVVVTLDYITIFSFIQRHPIEHKKRNRKKRVLKYTVKQSQFNAFAHTRRVCLCLCLYVSVRILMIGVTSHIGCFICQCLSHFVFISRFICFVSAFSFFRPMLNKCICNGRSVLIYISIFCCCCSCCCVYCTFPNIWFTTTQTITMIELCSARSYVHKKRRKKKKTIWYVPV